MKIKLIPQPKAAKMLGIYPQILGYWRKENKYPELRWVRYGPSDRYVGYILEDILKFKKKYNKEEFDEKYEIIDDPKE